MKARVWTIADNAEPMPPALPVLVRGLRVPLLKHYLRELRSGLIFWLILTIIVFHWAYLSALPYIVFTCLPFALFAGAAYFGRGLPILRIEAEALYIEDNAGKRAAYWREIGPLRYREGDGQPRLWWRPLGDELALPPDERDDSNRAKEHILQTPAAFYFVDPAREGPVFATYLNRIREHFSAADHQLL